jgi:hypothetical protein
MKHLIKGAMLALVVALAMTGQDEPRKTICGMNVKGPNELSRHTELIQVSCIDWAALAKIGVIPVPVDAPSQTQVLVHARKGQSFIAEVDGKWKLSGVLYERPDGLKAGMVVFDGADFTSLKISIQTELP